MQNFVGNIRQLALSQGYRFASDCVEECNLYELSTPIECFTVHHYYIQGLFTVFKDGWRILRTASDQKVFDCLWQELH